MKYSSYYSKTSSSIYQYYKDELILNDDGDVVGFDANNTSYSFFFKFKTKIKGQTCENSAKYVETAVPLKLILP